MEQLSNSYVRKEVLDESDHTEHRKHAERLKDFQHRVHHLDRMLQTFNGKAYSGDKSALAQTLNGVLKSKNIGGENGGNEHKAYFHVDNGSVVLVVNTLVNGKTNNNVGDIESLLSEIDVAFGKNTIEKKTPVQKDREKTEAHASLGHTEQFLTQHESSLRSINNTYREETNDIFMATDAVVEWTGGTSGRQIYEKTYQNDQKIIHTEYLRFLESFQGKNLNPSDRLRFEFSKRRFNALLSGKIESPESFVHYVTHDEKSIDYFLAGLDGMKDGVLEWAIGLLKLIWDIVVFGAQAAPKGIKYMIYSDYRAGVNQQTKEVYEQLTTKFSVHELKKIDVATVKKALEQEMNRIKNLPPEEQAHMIGKLTGIIIGTIAGSMGAKALVQSNTLRTALKPLAEGVAKIDIPYVKTWKELYAGLDQIDHIRFRSGFTGDELKALVDGVRAGEKSLSDIPNVGGLRAKVAALKQHGGVLPEETGMNKLLKNVDQWIRKGAKKTKEIVIEHIPGGEHLQSAFNLLGKITKTGYDILDNKITSIRNAIEWSFSVAKTIAKKPIDVILRETSEAIALAKTLDFPGKEKFLEAMQATWETLQKAKAAASEIGAFIGEIKDKVPLLGGDPAKKLKKNAVEKLLFEEGFAVEPVSDRRGNVLFHQFRDPKGNMVFGQRFKQAENFQSGQALVKTENGFWSISREGKWLIEPRYESLHTVSDGVKIGQKEGKFMILKATKWENGAITWYREEKEIFDFMTEPREGMVIAAKKVGEQEFKYLINGAGEVRKVDYVFVDDFLKEGITAAEDSNGVWHIINQQGKKVGNIEAKNNLEALQKHSLMEYESRAQTATVQYHRAEKMLRDIGLDGQVTQIGQEGFFLSEVNMNGKPQFGLIDAVNKRIIPPQFDHIQTTDAGLGFFRVKVGGKWGVIDDTGNILKDLMYDDINIKNHSLRLLEVQIGDKVGLVQRTEKEIKEIIPVEFSGIHSPRPGTYQGVHHGENYVQIGKGKIIDYTKLSGETTVTNTNFSTRVMEGLTVANTERKLKNGVRRVYDEETSEVVKIMRKLDTDRFLSGFMEPQTRTTLGFEQLTRKAKNMIDQASVDRAIQDTVDREFARYVNNYLGRNDLFDLHKEEKKILQAKRKEIAEELKMRMRRIIEERIQNGAIDKPSETLTDRFLSRFVENLDPNVFDQLEHLRDARSLPIYGT